jgi:hypothetical protein
MKSVYRTIVPPVLFIGGLVFLTAGFALGLGLILLACFMCAPRTQPRLYAFPTNCNGRIINVSASNGCTLTRADIVGMTPDAFEAQGFKEIGMDKVYANLREARVAGYRENTLQALLMSRITNIKGALAKSKISQSESVILPYISRRQKRNIQSNYWLISRGDPNPQAGKGSTPASAWDLTVANSKSPFANTLLNLEQYFLPGKYMFVEYVSGSAGSSIPYQVSYKILGAATVGSTTKVTVEPNVSAAGWAAKSAGDKLPWQVGGVSGGSADSGTIAYLGVNSVSDFESWGGQDNAENTNSLIHYWPQTSRIVHEYTDEYLRALNAALTSNYFKLFRQLPLAEQKRIQQAKYDRDMLNTAFFGDVINENQAVETYTSLPTVVDPANPNCVLEYKANALGFKTQLNACSRVINHQGNALNLATFLQNCYLVKRAREADGSTVEVIDVMTDRFTAGLIMTAMQTMYKAQFGIDSITKFAEFGQKLTFDGQVEMVYNIYDIPPIYGGFRLAVFTHPFFDDKLSAVASAAAGTATVRGTTLPSDGARMLWVLDWSDIELGVAGTNSAVRRTNEADQLYNYVIKINVKHVTLNSMTWCPIIEDPNRHFIAQNFSSAAPTWT